MKILGHNFLRSNFVEGDPVRKTANARQQNRTANFIKGLQGVGCRVVKDVASNLENCLIVVDGTSDVEYPPNWTPPWSTGATAVDQFTVVKDDDTHLKVYGGIWHRTEITRVEVSAGPPAVYEFHPKTQDSFAASTGSVKFGDLGAVGAAFAISAACSLWLKLDWSSVADSLTGEVLTGADDPPDMDEEQVYWLKFAAIGFAGGAITTIAQWHAGSIVTTDYGNPILCELE